MDFIYSSHSFINKIYLLHARVFSLFNDFYGCVRFCVLKVVFHAAKSSLSIIFILQCIKPVLTYNLLKFKKNVST